MITQHKMLWTVKTVYCHVCASGNGSKSLTKIYVKLSEKYLFLDAINRHNNIKDKNEITGYENWRRKKKLKKWM